MNIDFDNVDNILGFLIINLYFRVIPLQYCLISSIPILKFKKFHYIREKSILRTITMLRKRRDFVTSEFVLRVKLYRIFSWKRSRERTNCDVVTRNYDVVKNVEKSLVILSSLHDSSAKFNPSI